MSRALDGLLDLRFVVGPDGRTRVARRELRFPLRTTAPMYLDPLKRGMAFVYAQNPTGGVFADDRLRTRLALEEGASVHLTTQSATKVYRMEAGYGAHAFEITLAPGAYLELVPDVVIPQGGSRYMQTIDLEIACGASCFVTELIAPGRLARGERFAYAALDLRTRIVHAGREVVAETLLFEPSLRPPQRRGLLGRHPFVGTALAVAPGSDRDALDALLGAINEACSLHTTNAAAAGCLLPRNIGVTVRALADSHHALRAVLDSVWSAAREHFVGAPPPRRRK